VTEVWVFDQESDRASLGNIEGAFTDLVNDESLGPHGVERHGDMEIVSSGMERDIIRGRCRGDSAQDAFQGHGVATARGVEAGYVSDLVGLWKTLEVGKPKRRRPFDQSIHAQRCCLCAHGCALKV
jgi:hypothetical protein